MKALMKKVGLEINYQVDFCTTGLEAFELLREIYKSGMSYKLIITDFNMPVMNGIKSTYKIREFLEKEMNIQR